MSKNNPLKNTTPKNCNYKLYKSKKQWIIACATFLLAFGVSAVVTTASVQADDGPAVSSEKVAAVTVNNEPNQLAGANTTLQVKTNLVPTAASQETNRPTGFQKKDIENMSVDRSDSQTQNPNYILDKVEETGAVKLTSADAYISLTGDNGDGISYTGSPATLPLADLLHNISIESTVILDDGTQPELNISELTDSDFDWYDKTGIKLDEAPTNAGDYTIKLNNTGVQIIQSKNPNYHVIENNNSYGFKIKKAIGNVVLSGNKTVTFGDNNSDYYQNYQVKLTTKPKLQGIGYTLKAGDLKFSKDGKNWTNVVPTNVGDYQVTLSQKGWDDIKQANNAANIQWGATHITIADGTGYHVTPADASAVLSGSNEMAYRGSAVMASDLYHTSGTIKVSLTYPGANNAIFELKAGDYTWNTPNNAAPIAAGTYTLTLNDTGKQAIQAQIDQAVGQGNVVIKKITGSAAFTINPVTITVAQNGSAEKTYNGDPADVQLATVISDLNANNLIGGQTLNVANLTADDFDWYDANGNSLGKFSNQKITPKDAGQYTIKLNDAGLAALKAANSNYGFETVTGAYQYTIRQADATISLSESNNQQTATWNGAVISLDPANFIPVITDTSNNKTITLPKVDLTAGDYVITENGEVATAQAPGTYQVALTQSGWEKIRDAVAGNSNYNWTSTGNGLLTISKASAEITINGEGTVIYSGQAAKIPYTNADNQPTYKVTLSNGQNYTLKDGDLEFVQPDHTNVGTYQLKLSAQGLANIRQVAGDHYDYTYNNGTVLLHVTPATATYKLSGNQNHTYNGSAGEINVDNYQIAIQLNNDQSVTYTLQAGDIEILNGPAIACNTYKVSLTQAGLNHLKAFNPNYDWDIAKSETSATFVVTPAEMTVGITGEANTVYNGSSQPLTQAQIDQLSLVWGGLNNAPEGVTFPTLTPADVEYTEKQADGSYKVVEPLHAGTYQVGLTQAAIKRLNDQYPNGNYTYLLGKSTATYIINQHKAKVTLSGSQTAPYTQATDLNLKYFTVQLTDPATGHPVITYDGPLVADDLVISGYASDTHPVNVGNYQVKITDQLMDKLKAKYTDYDFGEKKPVLGIDAQSEGAEPNANIVEAKNNDGLYIITPINAYVHLTGLQIVYYNANGNYTIDSDKYSVSFDDELHQTIGQPNGFKLGLQFAGVKPTDVGNYKVTLDQATLDKIKQIGYVQNELGEMVHNYEWIMDITSADYDVQKMPVTVTVANAGEQPQSSIYGQPIKFDNKQYQITLVDNNGQHLTYTLQEGDLAFTNGVPTAVGTFAVQLSNQGIENIEKQYPTKNYDFTNVHTATYVVKAATPTITITPVDHDGHGQKVYDAQPAEIQSGDFTITLTTNNGQTLNVSLNSHDLEFKNGTPTNVGSYDVGLKADVINQLKTKYPNYDWDHIDKTVGQYTITPATGSAELNGTVEKPYDGSPIKDLSQIVVTVNYPGQTSLTYTLQAGDYQFEKDGNTYTNAPSDVGDYSIVLTKQGKTNIAKLGTVTEDGHEFKNVTWPENEITGVGHYIINPITIAVTLGGQQNETYNGTPFGGGKELVINGQDLSNCIQIEISTGNVQVPDINKAGLKPSEDFAIVDQDGKTVTDPINVGTYNVFLNQRGLDKLKKLEGADNFTWPEEASDIKSYGQLVIAPTTVSAELSGNNSMAYTGQPVTTKEINNAEKPGEIKVTIAVKVGEKDKTFTYALQDGDYTWVGGIVPTEIGNYDLALNKEAVLAHLKETIDQQDSDLKGNFVLTTDDLSGQASFTITQGEASAILSGQGQKVYDGTQPDTATQNEANNIKVTVTIPGEKDPQTITLAASDFDWWQGESKVDGVPTAAGDYRLILNDRGIKAIKAQFADNKNIKWTDNKGVSTITGQASYIIDKAVGTITFAGTAGKDFDNMSVITAELGDHYTVTINDTKQLLTTDQISLVDKDGQKVSPKDAGTYYVVLTDTGFQQLQKDSNYSWQLKWNGNTVSKEIGTYIISSVKVIPTLTGQNEKTYNGEKTSLNEVVSDGKIKLTFDSGDADFPILNYGNLSKEDYEWFNQSNQRISVPLDVGHYIIKLSASGLQNIQNYLNKTYGTGNVFVDSNDSSRADFDINPFKVTVKINGSETVDAGTTTISDGKYSLVFVPTKVGESLPTGWRNPNFTVADFEFTGNAPTTETNDGVFTVNFKGGQKGLQRLLGDNYAVIYEPGKNNYIVAAQSQSGNIFYIDKSGKEISKSPLSGKTGEIVTILPEIPAGWEKVPDQVIPSTVIATADGIPTVTILIQHIQITVEPNDPKTSSDKLPEGKIPGKDYPGGDNYPNGVAEDNLNKIIIRTIKVQLPDGKVEEHKQIGHLTRSAIVDLVTGKIAYSDWSTGKWDAFTPQIIDGYQASLESIATVTVTDRTEDQVVTINYKKIDVPEPTPIFIPVEESKVVTETIKYHFADGTTAVPSYVVEAKFTRTGLKNSTSGTINWNAWEPVSRDFAAVISPHLEGYHPDVAIIKKHEVTVDSGDLNFIVKYVKNDNQPETPDKPTPPATGEEGKPSEPETSDNDGPLSSEIHLPENLTSLDKKIVVVKKAANIATDEHNGPKNDAAVKQLPQTGNRDSKLTVVTGLSLLGVLSLCFGFGKKRRDR